MDSSLAVIDATTNPVELMPTELLLAIFEIFCPQSYNKSEQAFVRSLASVCQRWRLIILDTPTFWTCINLSPLHNMDPGNTSRRIPRFVLQLQRTKIALLDVEWDISGKPHPQLQVVVQAFAPVSRWRSLFLYTSYLAINRLSGGVPGRIALGQNAPSMPWLFGSFDNLEEMSLRGNIRFPRHFVDLVENTALGLRRLEAQTLQLPAVCRYFPKAALRVTTFMAI